MWELWIYLRKGNAVLLSAHDNEKAARKAAATAIKDGWVEVPAFETQPILYVPIHAGLVHCLYVVPEEASDSVRVDVTF